MLNNNKHDKINNKISFNKLKDCVVTNKNVLLRVDINVPIADNKIIDDTRIRAVVPTIEYLVQNKAKTIIIAHFGRPEGQFNSKMSLSAILPRLKELLPQYKINFIDDCFGDKVREAVENTNYGEIILLENLRFYKGETKNDPEFTEFLASLGNLYVNDAFSCSHRSHSSITGIATKLKSCAGFLMGSELENLNKIFNSNDDRITAIVAGSKVSTKIDLLNSLSKKVKNIIVGGAMANTFFYALGYNIGKSLCEKELKNTALDIIDNCKKNNCNLVLPTDLVTTDNLSDQQIIRNCEVKDLSMIDDNDIIADIGFETIANISTILKNSNKVIWNGPVGAFEIKPFNNGSEMLARLIALLTKQGKIISIAGGGDVVAAVNGAGLFNQFSYISTAGGAFLEWLEGKDLPGIVILNNNHQKF